MKKIIIVAIGSLCLGFAIVGGAWWYGGHENESIQAKVDETKTTENHIELVEEKNVDLTKEMELHMSESKFQQTIHEMSHQKIKASEKWGAIPLTEARVNRLLFILNANSNTFKHHEMYEKILMSWKEKDFSQAHIHHNKIWELQNGTKGKATGLLSIEEEKKFINDRFGE